MASFAFGQASDTASTGPSEAAPNVVDEELWIQQRIAERRAKDREVERRRTETCLKNPDGMVTANDPLRVAKRLDRVTRYLAGGDPKESPTTAPAEALVQDAVGRAIGADAPGAELSGTIDGSEPAAGELLERIINTADFVDVRYLDSGVVAQHAVGRVNIRNERGQLMGYGTGFLVSPRLLLTNHHVLPDTATTRKSVIEFDYQDGIDGRPLQPAVFSFDPYRLFVANRELDFALVAVAGDSEGLSGYGFCPLTAAQGTVIIGECVTIVQHPRGRKKQIALRENRLIDIPELVVHYAADTEPGSSGSPVFNDQWEVVALHHASVPTPERAPEYTFLNEGIRISRILKFLDMVELPPEQRTLIKELANVHTPARVVPKMPDFGGRPPAEEAPPSESSPGPPDDAGVVTFDVPLRITVRLGTTPGVTVLGAAAPIPEAPVPGARSPGAAPEAISIDPDYSNRDGYDPDFLGVPLPLPGVEALRDVASEELRYHHFSVLLNRARRLALFAAVNIDGKTAARPKRESDRWIMDPRVPREFQTGEEVYAQNDLDRGHLVRRLDPAWGDAAKAANDDTFHFTNSTPQHHAFNAGSTLWLGLEDYVLNNVDNHDLRVSVVSGPVLDDGDPLYRGVALPRQFFKLVAMVPASGVLSATAYLLSQEALLGEFATHPENFSFGAYRTFQVPVKRIAALTGLDLTTWIQADPLELLEADSLPREILRVEDLILR
ncbi:MAG TPA: DNA/RNA non-specific endonuclease [Actinomycetaceae bacterium]|nr:DNA/RNA non-specific endonuclease [Actinomycetaceae bacterium]